MTVLVKRVAPRAGGSGFAPLDFELDSGSTAVLTDDASSASQLLLLLGGLSLPRRGTIEIFGEDPARSPHLRAATGLLLPGERNFLGGTAREHLEKVRRVRQASGISQTEMPGFLPEAMLQRGLAELPLMERQQVALYSALCLQEPRLLGLFEPDQICSEQQRASMFERLRHLRGQRCVVLFVTTSLRRARRQADRILDLRVRRTTGRSGELVRFMLRVERPREVAARLLTSPDVLRATLDRASREHLEVEGTDPEHVAEAIVDSVLAGTCELFEMTRLSSDGRTSG